MEMPLVAIQQFTSSATSLTAKYKGSFDAAVGWLVR